MVTETHVLLLLKKLEIAQTMHNINAGFRALEALEELKHQEIGQRVKKRVPKTVLEPYEF